MTKLLVGGLTLMLLAVSSASATPLIEVGDHTLLANLAGQQIDIYVTGGDPVEGIDFLIQVDAGTEGPKIEGLDLITGTIFDGNNTGGSLHFDGERTAAFLVTTESGTVAAEGLLGTVRFDTTGIDSGTWDVNLAFEEYSTTFAEVATDLSHGTITIAGPSTLTWDGLGDGNWGSATQWTGGLPGDTPGPLTPAIVRANTVTVATDGDAYSLLIGDQDGQVVVPAGNALTVATGVTVTTGSLDIRGALQAGTMAVTNGTLNVASTGLVSLDDDLVILQDEDGQHVFAVDSSGGGRVDSAGDVHLDGTLVVQVAGSLGDPNLEEWGDMTRTIITAAGANGLIGTFSDEPVAGDHLGFGVFHQGVTYTTGAVDLDLRQAPPGDTDGDGDIDNSDLQLILAANSFNSPGVWDWPEGDFNGDLDVDNTDLQLVLATGLFGTGPYNAAAPLAASAGVVPEPGTLVLLAGGVLAVLLSSWGRRRLAAR